LELEEELKEAQEGDGEEENDVAKSGLELEEQQKYFDKTAERFKNYMAY
jgi:hypothetical protein